MNWLFPLENRKLVGVTDKDDSFRNIEDYEIEIPIHPHCGSFGAKRKHDRHRGVDLYTSEGTIVTAVEDGVIKMIRPWTGTKADCDWWEDTDAILIEGKSGLVVYAEIKVNEKLKVGDNVYPGEILGSVKRVLKKDKGRPMSMLHLELREPGFYKNIDKDWEGIPVGIKDPAPYLIKSLNL